MLQSSRHAKPEKFQDRRHLAEVARNALRLSSCFYQRQISGPRVRHEERFFISLIRVRPPRKRSDTERGQARSLRSETPTGHKEQENARRELL